MKMWRTLTKRPPHGKLVMKGNEVKKPTKIILWENLQLLALAGTITGQVVVGASFLWAQGIWLAANILSLVRDFVLHRPVADKVKNACLTGLTTGLIGAYMLGWYG